MPAKCHHILTHSPSVSTCYPTFPLESKSFPQSLHDFIRCGRFESTFTVVLDQTYHLKSTFTIVLDEVYHLKSTFTTVLDQMCHFKSTFTIVLDRMCNLKSTSMIVLDQVYRFLFRCDRTRSLQYLKQADLSSNFIGCAIGTSRPYTGIC